MEDSLIKRFYIDLEEKKLKQFSLFYDSWADTSVYKLTISNGIPFANNAGDVIYSFDCDEIAGGYYIDEWDNEKVLKSILKDYGYPEIKLLESVPSFLSHRTTVENFQESLQEIVKLFPKDKQQNDELIKQCASFLINNMTENEAAKLSELLQQKGCVDEKSLVSFLKIVINSNESIHQIETQKIQNNLKQQPQNVFYFINEDSNKLNRFVVSNDYEYNPRSWGTLGILACECVGNENSFYSLDNIFNNLCFLIPQEKFFEFLDNNSNEESFKDYKTKLKNFVKTKNEADIQYNAECQKYLIENCFNQTEKILLINNLQKESPFVALPIYVFNHSEISTSSMLFGTDQNSITDCLAGFDGFIYVTKEIACKEYGYGTKNWRKEVERQLNAEIDSLNKTLQNKIYKCDIEQSNPRYSLENNKITLDWTTKETVTGIYSNESGDKLLFDVAKKAKFPTNILKLSKLPDFVTNSTSLKGFYESLKQCIKCLPESKNNRTLVKINSQTNLTEARAM